MKREKVSVIKTPIVRGWLAVIAMLVLLLSLPTYASINLWYWESKGPFKNWTQVVDFEGDGDLDVFISHTRWEDVDISWAGIGLWLNQGTRNFELVNDQETQDYPFGGFAAAVGDIDRDGDLDVFTQDFGIHLIVNMGGLQGGEPGKYVSRGGINSPPAYNQGYRDMGGTIKLGDLNGDGRIDAFVAGCCYGVNAWEPGYDGINAPSVSWVWINDGNLNSLQMGHIIPMEALDGKPIREAALGDLDGDGDLDIYAAVGEPTMGTVDSLDDLILVNNGTGQFKESKQSRENSDSTSVALGDVNGDGRLDVLVGTGAGAWLGINQGVDPASGGPVFASSHDAFEAERGIMDRLQAVFSIAADRLLGLYLPNGSVRTKAIFLIDLNGDSYLDALLARVWGAEVWWNDGGGHFSRSQVSFEYREDTGVAAADFDGDGDQDIFTGRNSADFQMWWNDGKGAFTTTSQ